MDLSNDADIAALIAAQPPAGPRPRRPEPEKRETTFWTLPGFCWNARVTTSFGELPIQALRLRDPVRTSTGAFLPVEWIDKVQLDEGFLQGYPDAHPVLIQPGSVGRGRPASAMMVSPHQRIGMGETALAPDFRMARDLTGRPGVMRRAETNLTYYMFHCGRPVSVMMEGIWVSVAP
jgi:Hint domain